MFKLEQLPEIFTRTNPDSAQARAIDEVNRSAIDMCASLLTYCPNDSNDTIRAIQLVRDAAATAITAITLRGAV